MKRYGILSVAVFALSCGEAATSQGSNLGPRSDKFVVTGRYTFDDALWRRLSLIMPKGSIELYSLQGTTTLDMLGLAVKGKLTKKDGYDQILRSDFKALKLVEVNDSDRPPFDLVEYETGRTLGRINFSYPRGEYLLTDLCTGTAENLCTFTFDEATPAFSFEFISEGS